MLLLARAVFFIVMNIESTRWISTIIYSVVVINQSGNWLEKNGEHTHIETLLNNAKGTPEGRERGNMVACAPAMITLKCDVQYGNNISLSLLLLLLILL